MNDRVDVRLTSRGAERSRVELALGRLLRIDASASAALCDKAPVTLEHALPRVEAESIAQMLKAVGAEVELLPVGATPAAEAATAAPALGFVVHMDPGELRPRVSHGAPPPLVVPPPAPPTPPRAPLRLARTVAEFVTGAEAAAEDASTDPARAPGLVMSADAVDFVKSVPPVRPHAPEPSEVFAFMPPLPMPSARPARESERVAAQLGLVKQSLPPLPELGDDELQLPRLLDAPLGMPSSSKSSLRAPKAASDSIPPALAGANSSIPPALRGGNSSIPPALAGGVSSIPPALAGGISSIPPALRADAAPSPTHEPKPAERAFVPPEHEDAQKAVSAALDALEELATSLASPLHAWSTHSLAAALPKRGEHATQKRKVSRTRKELAELVLWSIDGVAGSWAPMREALEDRLPRMIGSLGPRVLQLQAKLGVKRKAKPAAASEVKPEELPWMPMRRFTEPDAPKPELGFSLPMRISFLVAGAGLLAHGYGSDSSVFLGNASTFGAVVQALAIFAVGLSLWPKAR